MNESIKISLIQGDNTVFKKNYLVDVIVEIPNDKTPLYIDGGEYICFFYFDETNQTWRELKDFTTSTISDRTIEANEFGDSLMLVPAGVPDLEEIQLPAEVRVCLKPRSWNTMLMLASKWQLILMLSCNRNRPVQLK